MTAANEMDVLADRLARAYEQNDADAIAACYAPDARIWHNIDGVERTVEEQLGATRWLNGQLKNLNYEIVSTPCFRRRLCPAVRRARQRSPTAAERSGCRSS